MLSQKTKTTSRKFYGKWLYKTSIRLDGCSIFRSKSIEDIVSFCQGEEPYDKHTFSMQRKAYVNRDIILDLCRILESVDKDSYNLRIESAQMDIYTNDIPLYTDLSMKFIDLLIHRFEPNAANIDLLNSDKNYITVDKLPKGRYNYRVYLLPHKMKGDREAKQQYLDWVKRQEPRITCTAAVEKWFMHTDWNWDRRYVLVEDESTLLMLKLRSAEVVGRIYNFVISDK